MPVVWEGMRLLQEWQIEVTGAQTGKPPRTVAYAYEPGSYAPLERIDSQEAANGERYSSDAGNSGGRGAGASQGSQMYYFHTDTAGLRKS